MSRRPGDRAARTAPSKGKSRQGAILKPSTLLSTVVAASAATAVVSVALVAPRTGRADTLPPAPPLSAADAIALERENNALRQLLADARATRTAGSAQTAGPGSVDHALTIAAATYGVPKTRLRAVAMCESTLNPTAANGPYVGLFQFGMPLWRSTPYGKLSRTDPYAAALAAAKTFKAGGARHWPVCGR